MAFQIDELLLIENITYIPDRDPLMSVLSASGRTVREYLEDINLNRLDEKQEYGSFFNGFDWRNVITAIKNNEKIMNTRIVDSYEDHAYGGGGGLAAVFINDEEKEAVVAFRGTATLEWADDMEGAAVTDTLQQINALEYFRTVVRRHRLNRYMITVTGHSKGGNKSKYITVLDDTPDRCVSFDGQGFSDKFMNHYRDRIMKRQGIIENHNIDYDYVNILMNDIGEATYYHGYDYGRGGFAEAHSPNTFFDFSDTGIYTISPNPAGQSTEMQLLDQFLNSLLRSIPSDKELKEATELVGAIAQTAFSEPDSAAFINFIFNLVADPRYSDNVAFMLAFFVNYERLHPGFVNTIAGIMSHFGMEAMLRYVQIINGILEWKMLDMVIGMTDFVVGHIPSWALTQVQRYISTKLGVELEKEQVKEVLSVVPMTHKALKEMKIVDDGSDITFTEETETIEEEFQIPEKMDILVLAGGLSLERNISLQTGHNIVEALRKKGHRVIMLDTYIGYGTSNNDFTNPFENEEKYSLKKVKLVDVVPDLWAVRKRRRDNSTSLIGPNVIKFARMADLIFIGLPGSGSETGKLQGLFDLYGLDYTGSNALAATLAMNKAAAKQIFVANGIKTPKWAMYYKQDKGSKQLPPDITFPVVVKPNCCGASIGVTVVNDEPSFATALNEAFKWENEVIVEDYIAGREFSVSMIADEIYPVLEINGMGDIYDVKHSISGRDKDRNSLTDISEEQKQKIKALAKKSAEKLGITCYCRADFRMSADGEIYCLECDALPALTKGGRFSRSVSAAGIDFDHMIEKIIRASL